MKEATAGSWAPGSSLLADPEEEEEQESEDCGGRKGVYPSQRKSVKGSREHVHFHRHRNRTFASVAHKAAPAIGIRREGPARNIGKEDRRRYVGWILIKKVSGVIQVDFSSEVCRLWAHFQQTARRAGMFLGSRMRGFVSVSVVKFEILKKKTACGLGLFGRGLF